jgi:hypothetical protein
VTGVNAEGLSGVLKHVSAGDASCLDLDVAPCRQPEL